jgi:hypothetical protein
MTVNCPHTCNTCELLDPKIRCDRARLNISTEPIYESGDMQAMFKGISKAYKKKYGVKIISKDPWIVTFENFLSDEEVNALIETVSDEWERSTNTGEMNEVND